MAKKKREEKPFAIQQLFMHKAKPWKKCSLTKSDSALNTIIRRLKCSNASKLFSKKPSDQKLSRSDSSKFPFLSRNLERSVNNWPSFEHKCREYAVQKEKTKEEESNKVEEESNHVEPIVEFPPDDADDHQNNENVPGGETKDANPEEPTTSGLTRWKNTAELMPSPIVSNRTNKYWLNNCSFETVQSLPTDSPTDKFRSRKPARKADTISSTMPFMDRSTESCLPQTPDFMSEWKAKSKSRKRQLHSTPKNAFS